MPQSLSHIYLHLVFSTKNHQPFIDVLIQPELYAYIAKILYDECSSPAKIIGGVEDHIHILFNLSRTQTVARVVEMIKKRSSKWIKTKGEKYRPFNGRSVMVSFPLVSPALRLSRNILRTRRNTVEQKISKLNFEVFSTNTG